MHCQNLFIYIFLFLCST